MAGKKKKRYSMRGKMITVNMGIMLGALLLCGSIFVFSVFFIISDYIHHDMDFFLTATADGMESGLSYLEKVIYALRDSETVMGYMKRAGTAGLRRKSAGRWKPLFPVQWISAARKIWGTYRCRQRLKSVWPIPGEIL